MAATALGIPIQEASAFASSSTPSLPGFHPSERSLRATRSASTFRTPHSSDNDLSADASHLAFNTGNGNSSINTSGGIAAISLSPPPDLSFSKSSLHSDHEAELLSRIEGRGGSSGSHNQPYSDNHQQHLPPLEHVRIASSSNGHVHDPAPSSFPYHQDGSWGSRASNNNNNLRGSSSKSRIRLDSVFGTQLPGFPYLNSAAAATSSALGHPINPHYHYHHGSSSSADLLKGRSSYVWSERSGSSAGHYHPHVRAPTSHSTRSTHGKESLMSMGRNAPASRHRANTATTTMTVGKPAGDVDTFCSGETGESNSSDEVDLDLSFDMDLLRARQLQQFKARQQREAQGQGRQIDISSSQVHAQRQARIRALSSSESLPHSKSGHVGIDMLQEVDVQNEHTSPGLPYQESEEHRRYVLGGKKRLSRSAAELRTGRSSRLPSATILADNPLPAFIRPQPNHPYRQSGALSSTMPSSFQASRASQQPSKSSHAQPDLAINVLLDQVTAQPPHPAFMDEDESSAHLGWSFATTPPLSPAEVVTYAEGAGNISKPKGQRRYSAGASSLFQAIERKKSSSELLQRKRRPSFPLMSLFDKANRAPVVGSAASTSQNTESENAAPRSPHSPDSDVSWGSPTPRESVVVDFTTTLHPHPQQAQTDQRVPLYPLPPVEHQAYERSGASISDLAETSEDSDIHLPPPPRLHDPARLGASPISSIGTPCTLSPDMGATNSTFSSPRSPSDDLPTPRTAEFIHHRSSDGNIGNRYSQFSLKAISDGAISFTSAGSETLEGGCLYGPSKRESRIFGIEGDSPAMISANLEVIPEQSDSPQKFTAASSASSPPSSADAGTSPNKTKGPSASDHKSAGSGETQSTPPPGQIETAQQNQGHRRQSSSLFRFPFVSSLRNPFASRSVSGPSAATETSPHLNDLSSSTSSSHDSPSGSIEELLTTSSIAAGIVRKNAPSALAKRSGSPNSSEESHFSPASHPPSPPRPGATSEASKGVDPSMLREGPNTGKGRLSGLGLSFPATFVNSNSSHQHQEPQQPTKMHPYRQQAQRQASLPVLSFSAASDEQHEVSARSIESEEAAIQVVPDENGYGRPVDPPINEAHTRQSISDIGTRPIPASAPATTVHFNHPSAGLHTTVEQLRTGEFGTSDMRANSPRAAQPQVSSQYRRPRTRLSSAHGLDLRGHIDLMRPSQLLFLAAFIAGPWCFLIGGWCLRSIDGDYRSVKGVRCYCPSALETCDCHADVYKQIKLSGGQVDRVLQSQNGHVRKMDRFVLANRVAALTCGTGTLVLAITALIVVGRAW